jgi:hypothetical protein
VDPGSGEDAEKVVYRLLESEDPGEDVEEVLCYLPESVDPGRERMLERYSSTNQRELILEARKDAKDVRHHLPESVDPRA